MKKLWLVLMLAMVVVGCGKETGENKGTEPTTTPVEQQENQNSGENIMRKIFRSAVILWKL